MRQLVPESDLVPVPLEKGTNRILLKIYNGTGEWGFSCRVLSTVGDLYRWSEALFGGKVLKPETLGEAWRPVPVGSNGKLTEPSEDGYGFGWGITHVRGSKVIGHSGGLPGFLTDMNRYVEEKLTTVILTNAAEPPPSLVLGDASARLAAIYLWKEWKPREAPKTVSVKTRAVAS